MPRPTLSARPLAALVAALLGAGCLDDPLPSPGLGPQADQPATCDEKCQDGVALRSVREAMKLVYNLTLQGKPVGFQSASTPCPEGGSADVQGNATSNAEQGATQVYLTYTFHDCVYRQIDSDLDERDENYVMKLDGVISQSGLIAVQPSATTALLIASDSLSLEGQVYSPPTSYQASECVLQVSQSGDEIAGTFCTREAGFTF